jgi:High potential iron-sulfur protein
MRESRRIFLTQLVAVGAAVPAGQAWAQSGAAQVDEASETAVALGYRHDTAAVDAKKFPQHQAAQRCTNCSFWQGKPDATWAGCAMFGRKQVAAAGWCQVWAKVPG